MRIKEIIYSALMFNKNKLLIGKNEIIRCIISKNIIGYVIVLFHST